MSHTTVRKTKIRNINPDIFARVITRLGGSMLTTSTGTTRSNTIVFRLPYFRYALSIDQITGNMRIDSMDTQSQKNIDMLDRMHQYYTVELGREQAEKLGGTFSETQLSNGDIECVITIGDAVLDDGSVSQGALGTSAPAL